MVGCVLPAPNLLFCPFSSLIFHFAFVVPFFLSKLRLFDYYYYHQQLLEAHDGNLRGLCLTASGHLLATASVKGMTIRVWDIATSKMRV